jgi:hypothetical protein
MHCFMKWLRSASMPHDTPYRTEDLFAPYDDWPNAGALAESVMRQMPSHPETRAAQRVAYCALRMRLDALHRSGPHESAWRQMKTAGLIERQLNLNGTEGIKWRPELARLTASVPF